MDRQYVDFQNEGNTELWHSPLYTSQSLVHFAWLWVAKADCGADCEVDCKAGCMPCAF